jgi:hypothetical protein
MEALCGRQDKSTSSLAHFTDENMEVERNLQLALDWGYTQD